MTTFSRALPRTRFPRHALHLWAGPALLSPAFLHLCLGVLQAAS